MTVIEPSAVGLSTNRFLRQEGDFVPKSPWIPEASATPTTLILLDSGEAHR